MATDVVIQRRTTDSHVLQYVSPSVTLPVGMHNIDEMDADFRTAINVISATYGDTVSFQAKKKNLLKFGRSTQANATNYVTVMGLPTGTLNETYETTNAIDFIVSTSASDTMTVGVEGHTINAGDLTFVSFNVVLNGTTPVTLGTPLARCNRLANLGSANNVGVITAYSSARAGGVSGGNLSDGSGAKCQIAALKNQSEKCATSISSVDYWVIQNITCSVLTKTSATAEFRLETRDVKNNGVFRPSFIVNASNTSTTVWNISPNIIVPKNHDVRMVCLGSGNIEVAANMNGKLAIVL